MEHNPAQQYLAQLAQLIETVLSSQPDAFAAAIESIATCIEQDGLVHLFGTGHSHMLAEEGLYRAGGLANVSAWLEPSLLLDAGARGASAFERLPGVAAIILDKYRPAPTDVLIVFSNSGVNAVPVEIAAGARERQVTVIAVTSRDYSLSVAASHPSGKRLLDLADIVIDNRLPPGDAIASVQGVPGAVGPGSTVIGAAILNALLIGATAEAARRGVEPPIYISANIPGAAEHNAKLVKRFAKKIRHL